jgi:hypothetical protein
MKKNKLFKLFSVSLLSLSLAVSCNKDEEQISSQDTQDISDENQSEAYFQDLDDMTAVTVASPSDTEYSTGRVSSIISISDNRFECAQVTLVRDSDSNADFPKGVITIDFGTTGCTDARQNVRTGKVILTYNGKRYQQGSTIVTTLDNYTVNDIKLEGVRTLTNVQASPSSAPRFNVVLQNGKATFPDATVATRTSNITWQWERAANPVDDQLIIDQASTASGTTRKGRNYEVSLLEDLVYKRFCGMAVQGVKKYIINGAKTVTIDYGDGACDRSVTVTVNDITRKISI